MKRIASVCLCLLPFALSAQSSIVFDLGTNIDVGAGADICADVVTINGTYSGSGTACSGPLPVELVSMTAIAARSGVTLRWSTATESNNYGFEIERKTIHSAIPNPQSALWSSIAFVRGAGTSSSSNEYTYTDDGVTPGRHAYRIRQIDASGEFAFTEAIEVEVGLAPKEFMLSQNFPNPFNPTTTVEFTLPEDGRVSVKLYDATGREVLTALNEDRTAGYYHQVVIDASQLGSGSYFCRIEFGGQQITRKMLLLK
jgi:hypothetical protein